MAASATQRLYEAICANSPTIVLELLETDADANRPFMLPYLNDEKEEDEDGDVTISKALRLVRTSSSCKATPIFLAARNAYENYGDPDSKFDSDAPRARNARAIIQHLIDHGADVKRVVDGLVVCNIEDYRWIFPSVHCTPIDLILFLKQHLSYYKAQGTFLDMVLDMVQRAAHAAGHVKPPTARVACSVVTTWDSLCLSEKFSDVRFVCSEGDGEHEVVLHAHKAVLAAASDYFSTLFTGPWADNCVDGAVKTSNSAHIMRAILTFVYTGRLEEGLLDANAPTLVGIASEYGLLALGKLAEQSCIRSLALDNVKGMLQLAHLHEASELKTACHLFVQRHAAAVLTNPEMMSLATEQPALWAELAAKIVPAATQSAGSKKRART